jgi:sugar phosphate isomerase/epimerase
LGSVQIRLLMASSSKRENILDSTRYIQDCCPWVFDCYREAIDRIHERGCAAVIENEVGRCLFSKPLEITGFFSLLDRADRVSLIWDIQNFWQTGTFPSLEVYESLKPYIGMIHVKGGRAEIPGGRLKWRCSLEDASWPVVPIIRRAIADGVSPVICLNPSHGEPSTDYVYEYKDDLAFLRREIEEIE